MIEFLAAVGAYTLLAVFIAICFYVFLKLIGAGPN